MPSTKGSPRGERIYWEMSEATLDGARIKARTEMPGGDWYTAGPDGYGRPGAGVQPLGVAPHQRPANNGPAVNGVPRVPRSKADWSRKLTYRIRMKDGTFLVTLGDAARAIEQYFATVTQSRPLESTIELLMKAAETGKREDIKAATERVHRQLQSRRVLQTAS